MPLLSVLLACLLVGLAKPDAEYFNSPRYYLLSTIAQALAAAFALAFTVALLGAQFASRYTQRATSAFFDLETVLHAVLFVIAICYPIVLLVLRPSSPLYDAVAIGLAAYCLLWLVHLFVSLKARISPSGYLATLIQNFLATAQWYAVDMDHRIFAPIDEVESIMWSAYAAKDYGTFKLGYTALVSASVGTMFEDAGEAEQEVRSHLASWAVAVGRDAQAVAVAAKAITEVHEAGDQSLVRMNSSGRREIRKLWDAATVTAADLPLVNSILKAFGRLALTAARRRYPTQAEDAVNDIHRTALEWCERTATHYPYEAARQVYNALMQLTIARGQEEHRRPKPSSSAGYRDPMETVAVMLVKVAACLWTASAMHVHTTSTDGMGNVVHNLVRFLRSNPKAYEQGFAESLKRMKPDVASAAALLHGTAARLAANPPADE
jgi:hypothetical protein